MVYSFPPPKIYPSHVSADLCSSVYTLWLGLMYLIAVREAPGVLGGECLSSWFIGLKCDCGLVPFTELYVTCTSFDTRQVAIKGIRNSLRSVPSCMEGSDCTF